MAESAAEYRARLAGYAAGKDPVAIQRDTPGILAGLLDGVPAAKLKQRPAPRKWSVVEIVMHLADDELVSSWRYRQMLEHAKPDLAGFDQDRWAEWGDYA